MNINKRERTLIFALLILVAIGAFYLYTKGYLPIGGEEDASFLVYIERSNGQKVYIHDPSGEISVYVEGTEMFEGDTLQVYPEFLVGGFEGVLLSWEVKCTMTWFYDDRDAWGETYQWTDRKTYAREETPLNTWVNFGRGETWSFSELDSLAPGSHDIHLDLYLEVWGEFQGGDRDFKGSGATGRISLVVTQEGTVKDVRVRIGHGILGVLGD